MFQIFNCIVSSARVSHKARADLVAQGEKGSLYICRSSVLSGDWHKCCIIDEPCSEGKGSRGFGTSCILTGVLYNEMHECSFTANLINLGKLCCHCLISVWANCRGVKEVQKQSPCFKCLVSKVCTQPLICLIQSSCWLWLQRYFFSIKTEFRLQSDE